MSHTPRIAQSDANSLPQELVDLEAAIGQLPPEYLGTTQPLMAQVIESSRRRRRILSLVQEALGQLRLDMKYLTFDLEATRRERDVLREEIEGD